ncbi:phosphotransferase [Actinoplanes sp. CA-142083]|uniref:phosphotransferase n=1 Tax=Actinoplanes sp. CA-142083 TaxID=3239903 RepID=UPI003D8D14E3
MVSGRVMRRFGLGDPVGAPVRVPGGLSNELWRVTTAEGVFAVKRMVVNADRPDFVGNVEASFGVEWRAWRSGVPMPEPLSEGGRALVAVDGSLYRAHRWVESREGAASVRDAAGLLARIHAAGEPRWAPAVDGGWDGRRWGAEVAGLARRVAEQPARVLVVDSHRDLDRKNTLLGVDGVLMAVDWDAAGPVSAVQEVVAVALDWSGGDPGAFAEGVGAYGRVVPAEPWVFGGWVAAQGGWLDYVAEHQPGEAERTLAELRGLAAGLDVLLSVLPSPPGR